MAAQDASRTRPSWGRRLVGIEGLRGVAAVSVIIGHIQIHLAKDVGLGLGDRVVGNLHHGLTLFFALSGFLLFRPFAAAILGTGPRPPVLRFFQNRALRIYPAYVVIFLVSAYVLQTTYIRSTSAEGVEATRDTLGPITDPFDVLANLSMLHTLLPQTVKTGLGASWSLTTELTYYLALPVVAAIGIWLARRRLNRVAAMLVAPGVLIVTGLGGKLIGERTLHYETSGERLVQLWGATWHAVFERSILVHADLFGYGAAAATLFVLAESDVLSARSLSRLRVLCWAFVLFTLALLLTRGLPIRFGADRWDDSWMALAFACLILIAALPTVRDTPSAIGRLLETRIASSTGLISYSLYLWHLPVLWWLATHGVTAGASPAGFAANVALVVGVTYALSALTYHVVEKPALRLKKRTDRGVEATAVPVSHAPLPVPVPAGR
jgi:peptidoglycan/LPS O-acetylase OafA/YrhL